MVSLTIWSNNTVAAKTSAISTLAATWIDLWVVSPPLTFWNHTHRRRHQLVGLDIGNDFIINNQFRINLPIPLHPQYSLLSWEINKFGTYLEFPVYQVLILVDMKVGDLPVIFDFTHPTSWPLSAEPGLGRVMVVARVQTVVAYVALRGRLGRWKLPLSHCSTSLDHWVMVYQTKMEERALPYFSPFESLYPPSKRVRHSHHSG